MIVGLTRGAAALRRMSGRERKGFSRCGVASLREMSFSLASQHCGYGMSFPDPEPHPPGTATRPALRVGRVHVRLPGEVLRSANGDVQ